MEDYRLVKHEETFIAGMSIVAGNNQTWNSRLINVLWKEFNANLRKIGNRTRRKDWVKFGLTFDNIPARQYTYLAGVEVDNLNTIPEGMTGKVIQAQYYAVFCHKGSHLKLKETMYKIYRIWIPQYNLKITSPEVIGFNHFERYDARFNWSNPDSEIDIYVPVANSAGLNQKIKIRELL